MQTNTVSKTPQIIKEEEIKKKLNRCVVQIRNKTQFLKHSFIVWILVTFYMTLMHVVHYAQTVALFSSFFSSMHLIVRV